MATGPSGPFVATLALWAVVAAACSPLLRSARVRAPLERWPTERLGANYLVLTGAVVAGHAATFLAGVVVTGGFGGTELVRWTMAVAGGYPLGLWLLAGVVASTRGGGASASGGRGRWVAFGLAAAYYAVVVVVAAAVVFFVLFVAYYPG